MYSGVISVTVPPALAIIPRPGEYISIRGTISIRLPKTEIPSTHCITVLALNLSDIQPPRARIIPEGRLNMEANNAAVTKGMV